MANLSKTVEIIFAGKNEASKVIGTIEKDFTSLNATVTAATGPLASIADFVFKLDAALLALAVGGLAYAYDKAIKFETAMVSFRKVSDGTPESLNAARAAAFGLSTQYGATAVSVLNSSTDFIQAGYNTQESLKLTEAGLKLMMAGEISVAEASQFMITILKGFKAPAEDAGRLTDILNQVSDKTATNVRELAIGMAYLSPIAKLMGLSFEETAGLLTPVIEVFSSGSEATHGLRTGLLRIVDDSAPVTQALEQLGVSQTDVNGKLRSGKDILLDVQKAYVGLDDPTRIFLAQQLAGKDQAAKMLEVFNGLNKTLEITNIAMGAAGSIAKEVALRLESSQIQVDRFKVGFENLGIVIGEQFKVAATGAATGANAILQAMNGLVVSGAFAPLFDELSKMGNELSQYFVKIAKVLPEAMKGIDFSGLLASLKKVGGEIGEVFTTIFGDVDLTTAEGLHKTIQAVVDALGKLVAFTAGMIKGMEPLWQSIKLGIDQFSKMDSQGVTLAGTFIGVGKAVNVLTENAGLLTGALYLLTTKALVETGTALAGLGVKALGAVGGLGALSAAAGVAVPILGIGIAGAAGVAAGSLLNQIPVVQKLGQAFWSLLDVNEDYFGALGKSPAEIQKIDEAFAILTDGTRKVATSLKDIPLDLKTNVSLNTGTLEGDIMAAVKATGVLIGPKVIPVSWGPVVDQRYEISADGTIQIVDIYAAPAVINETNKKINDALAKTEKARKAKIKAELKMDETKLKEQSDIIQKQLEWKAKVDIANIEQVTKTIEATFKSVDTRVSSSATVIGDLLKSLSDDKLSSSAKWKIEDLLEDEAERRKTAMDQSEKLADQQIELNAQKLKALERGDSMIKISADGLKPHLEMILWEILEAIQIRANESGSEFLLGVK